jgi:hypothetical protein
VTVGEYAGVPLQDAGDAWRHGAVFLLRKPPIRSDSVSLNGWVTSVVRGQKVVITCGSSTATDFETTFIEALNAANRGLDYLSATGQADCAIRNAPNDCLIWWPDAAQGGVVMRYTAVEQFGRDLTLATTGRDANGNIVPSAPPPTPAADDALRFVRMARTSDDLFDAYRNLFLAFESLLSSIRPRRRVIPAQHAWWHWSTWRRRLSRSQSIGNARFEPERVWFMDALDKANGLVPVAGLTPPHIRNDANRNHAKWIYKSMYQKQRSGLMHAKKGEDYLLPHDTADRAELIDSIGRLWPYIKNLIEKQLGVRGRLDPLPRDTAEHQALTTLGRFTLLVSDDEGPVNPEAGTLINSNATLVQLRSSAPRVDPDDPELFRLLAHCDAADLFALNVIRRCGHMSSNGTSPPAALTELVGPLVLGPTVVRLEMDRGLRHVNPTGPPRQFSS